MQDLHRKDSTSSSAHPTSTVIANLPSWWSSTDSDVHKSSLSNALSLKMEVPSKCLALKFQDQDSLSTQSMGQHYFQMASMGGSSACGQGIFSAESGFDATCGKPLEGHMKLAPLMGNQDSVFRTSAIDYGQPIAHFPVHYAEPWYGGLRDATNLRHAMLMGITSTRVPLPLYYANDEVTYVNAKQYHAILRRRQRRAKTEAQNKVLKNRKPYLHESRHRHAVNRPRGSGGRFLNRETLQKSNANTTDGVKMSDSAQKNHTGNVSESEVYQPEENYQENASPTSCSDVTSAYNSDDVFQQQPEYRFSGYPFLVGKRKEGGGNHQDLR